MTAPHTEKIGGTTRSKTIPKKSRTGFVTAGILAIVAIVTIVAGTLTNWYGLAKSDQPSAPESVSVLMQTEPDFINRVMDAATGKCVGVDTVSVPGSNGGTFMYGNTAVSTDWWPDNNGVTVKLDGGARRQVTGFIVAGERVGTVSLADSMAQEFELHRADFGGSVPEGQLVMCITTPST